ncbi:MAG: AAA-like domain-containing protein [Anaerolineae bacterium]|nr:AAA-like domain-containing protein [Anaerolineae bacterium]
MSGRVAHKPDIRVAGNITLTGEIETVLRAMFKTFGQIAVEAEFGRGFSGSRTFRVRLVEPGGKAYLPAAIKIAPVGLIQAEWQAYQTWVAHTIPNIAHLEGSPVLLPHSQWGGLRYSLVGGGTFPVKSLRDYCQEATTEDLCWVLENRLFEILGSNWWLDSRASRTFQMQSDYDLILPVNLVVKFRDSLTADRMIVLEGHDYAPTFSGLAGDFIRIKGFVVTKADQNRQELTLNLPSTLEGDTPFSFRIRIEEVRNVADYQVGQVIDSTQGVIAATRHSLLVEQVSRAFGETIDPSASQLTLPDNPLLSRGRARIATQPSLKQNHVSPNSNTKSGRLTAAHPTTLPNPLLTYQNLLHDFLAVNISTVHGDLNLENILLDPATREVSLIDFATVRQGHVLHDLLRLETEVLVTLLPPLLAEASLPAETIVSFYRQLHQAVVHNNGIASLILPAAGLRKPFEMLLVIRSMARKCLFNLDDWREYYRGLELYLLGALKFGALDDSAHAPLPKQVAFWGAASAQYLLDLPVARPKQRPIPKPVSLKGVAPAGIEPPFGTMHPDSLFYVEREADEQCWQQLTSSYAVTLFVQAPMQIGKSSLMRRVLHQIKQVQQYAYIDFQKFTEQYLADEENFFIQLCLMIGDALGVPEAIDQYWTGRRTNIVKCSRYMTQHVIPRVNGAFILAMDEVERMQSCSFRGNFFGMLRTWHNDRVDNEYLAKMNLFLSSSTDPYLLIDNPHQSPFNVATPISLQDFTLEEVNELNRRHNSPLTPAQVNDLRDLVEGHPFLTRLALYLLALGKINLPALLTQATADEGPFGDHLRHYLRRVLRKPELKQALTRVSQNRTLAEDEVFHRLREAGLIKKSGQDVIFRNKLYERYFKERLNG